MARRALGIDLAIPEVSQEDTRWPSLACLQACPEGERIQPGVLSSVAGRFAYHAVERGVRLAMAGRVHGIVTAPLNKEALNKAGYHFAGHTDMLAALTGARGSVMMLATAICAYSRHDPCRARRCAKPADACSTSLRDREDRRSACRSRRAASAHRIAALNPHAGEGGTVRPRTSKLRRRRCGRAGRWIDVVGPVPGDTIFVKLRAAQYDAAIAMYHDQGHIPVKLLGFQVDPATGVWNALSGVNITLGLPIVRTSVDHGTAFDIAGKGVANEQSLVEAIEYAVRLSSSRSAI